MDERDRGTEPTRGAAPLTVRDLQEQARRLKDAQGFHVSLEQRLAYCMAEVGKLAEEVLKLSAVKEADGSQARERLGMEIYDVVRNPRARSISTDIGSGKPHASYFVPRP